MTAGKCKRLQVAMCALAVLAVAVTAGVHFWTQHRLAKEKAAERQTYLAGFGIESDGTEDFVPLPPTITHAMGAAKIGADLFCDRRLAGSKVRTCASCHQLNYGGSDGQLHGGKLTRTVFGAPLATLFLHDGSLTNLNDVVAHMIAGRDFANGGDVNRIVRNLGADEKLFNRFRSIYKEGLTPETLCDAIAQFNRTLVPQSEFDAYLAGNKNALSDDAKAGMKIFRKRNCLACHDGPLLGGTRVSEGRKVAALRGLGIRNVYLANGSLNELGAVLALMPKGNAEDAERAQLISFLKSL